MYKALKSVIFNGTFYEKGDEIKINTKEELVKLSEKGFIRPLSLKEIQDFGKTKVGKEVEKDETTEKKPV